MGCCQTAHAAPAEASPEERALCLRESSLGYSKHHAKVLVDELLRLTEDGKFSPSDMNSLAFKFELNIKDLDDPDSSLNAFYRNLKGEKGTYRPSPLGALIVLLAKGTAQDKAALLYQLIPPSDPQHDTGVRSAVEVRQLLETLVNLACLWLPKLSQAETLSDPGTLPTEKVETLLESARSRKEAAVEDLLSSLMKGKEGVSQADFVMELSTSKLKALTASYDLRKFVLG